MVKRLFLLTIELICFGALAQEPLISLLPEKDSAMIEAERRIMYHQLLSGTLPEGNLTEPFQLPEFNFQRELNRRWEYGTSSYAIENWPLTGWIPDFPVLGGLPLLRNETIFSSSVYHLNGRFSFGGYSFGAGSGLTAPLPNQGLNHFDVRGSSLFLKYNVSKNIKIETRVNVTHGPAF